MLLAEISWAQAFWLSILAICITTVIVTWLITWGPPTGGSNVADKIFSEPPKWETTYKETTTTPAEEPNFKKPEADKSD
jgi:hypothetical protein